MKEYEIVAMLVCDTTPISVEKNTKGKTNNVNFEASVRQENNTAENVAADTKKEQKADTSEPKKKSKGKKNYFSVIARNTHISGTNLFMCNKITSCH